jgi:hypothetical protein
MILIILIILIIIISFYIHFNLKINNTAIGGKKKKKAKRKKKKKKKAKKKKGKGSSSGPISFSIPANDETILSTEDAVTNITSKIIQSKYTNLTFENIDTIIKRYINKYLLSHINIKSTDISTILDSINIELQREEDIFSQSKPRTFNTNEITNIYNIYKTLEKEIEDEETEYSSDLERFKNNSNINNLLTYISNGIFNSEYENGYKYDITTNPYNILVNVNWIIEFFQYILDLVYQKILNKKPGDKKTLPGKYTLTLDKLMDIFKNNQIDDEIDKIAIYLSISQKFVNIFGLTNEDISNYINNVFSFIICLAKYGLHKNIPQKS